MFEDYTLADQNRDRIKRGWDLEKIDARPDPTAEIVIYRKPKKGNYVFDHEILEAYRVKGIEDCRNRWQGKWGTQVRPAEDRTSRHAIQRAIREFFGWEIKFDKFQLAAVMGPWIHKATVTLSPFDLRLHVSEKQGEVTPWKGDIFCLNATGLELPEQGGYTVMENTHWITLGELIDARGQDASYLYWSVIAACIPMIFGYDPMRRNTTPYFGPGEYRLWDNLST